MRYRGENIPGKNRLREDVLRRYVVGWQGTRGSPAGQSCGRGRGFQVICWNTPRLSSRNTLVAPCPRSACFGVTLGWNKADGRETKRGVASCRRASKQSPSGAGVDRDDRRAKIDRSLELCCCTFVDAEVTEGESGYATPWCIRDSDRCVARGAVREALPGIECCSPDRRAANEHGAVKAVDWSVLESRTKPSDRIG